MKDCSRWVQWGLRRQQMADDGVPALHEQQVIAALRSLMLYIVELCKEKIFATSQTPRCYRSTHHLSLAAKGRRMYG